MNFNTWLQLEQDLTSAALTVRAQSVSPNDNGRLRWDTVMPRVNVDTIDLEELTTGDYRPVSDRREWDGPGRLIHLVSPTGRRITMIPIEGYHKIEELELTRIVLQARGNQQIFRDVISAPIPARTEILAAANYRRIEVDVMTAWSLGQITVRNPQYGHTYTVSYGIDAARYATAGTAWNDPGVNAYTELMAWLRDTATNLIGGPVAGVMLRQATLNAIQVDAPNILTNIAGIPPTIRQIEQRITDELGAAFRFVVNEDTVQVYSGAGLTQTSTKVWPAQRVAAIPAGRFIGETSFAPTLRAFEIAGQTPEARVDVNGTIAYRLVKNDGKELEIQVQTNAIPRPNEQVISVINAGV